MSIASISAVDEQHSEVQLGAQKDEHPDWHCPIGGAGATIGALQQVVVHAGAHVLGHPLEHCTTGGCGAKEAAQHVGVHVGAQVAAHVPGHAGGGGGGATGRWIVVGGNSITCIGGGCWRQQLRVQLGPHVC